MHNWTKKKKKGRVQQTQQVTSAAKCSNEASFSLNLAINIRGTIKPFTIENVCDLHCRISNLERKRYNYTRPLHCERLPNQ